MKNLFKKSKKKIPDEIAARQVSFKVLKKKTSFEADRHGRESTQQTHTDAAKFLQRMESIGEVHMDFHNEDMQDELDLIHRHRRSAASRQSSRKGRSGEQHRDIPRTEVVKPSPRNAMTAPTHKLEKMDLHGHDSRVYWTRPRNGSTNNRDLPAPPPAGKMVPPPVSLPQNTDARPVRKATYKRGSMDVCLGFDDSGSDISKDVNSPPPRKRRSLDMTDAATEDYVRPDVMEIDPRIAALHAAAHNMHKQQLEDRKRIHPDPRGSRNIDNIKHESMQNRQTMDAEMMNRQRILQKQVSMPEEAPRHMVQQQFIKRQSMRQFSKAEHEARQVQLLQKQKNGQPQVIPQRQQMMKQQSVRQNSIPVHDQQQVPPKEHIMKQQSVRQGPMPREMLRQTSHKQVRKEQQIHDLNRKSLVQDTARDVQVQLQQTANVWDEINSQQFEDKPQVSVQQNRNEVRNHQQQLMEVNRNNMHPPSRSKIIQQEQQPRDNMRPDHISAIPIKKPSNRGNEQVLMRPDQISAIPIKKPSSKERLMQIDHIPVKSMYNEQSLMRPDQISAIPMKKRTQPPQDMHFTLPAQSMQREQFREQGQQISSRQLRSSPKMQPQRYPNGKEQLTTIALTDRPNLTLVRNNASREQNIKSHMDQRKEHDEWYQSELNMPRVPSDQMLRARNARFHQMQKQESVRTYQSNSSSESRGKDVRTEMIRTSRMKGQSTRTFESNSSSESRESARLYTQVSAPSVDTDVPSNKADDMIEQMTIVKRRPTLKRGSMDTSLAIIEDL